MANNFRERQVSRVLTDWCRQVLVDTDTDGNLVSLVGNGCDYEAYTDGQAQATLNTRVLIKCHCQKTNKDIMVKKFSPYLQQDFITEVTICHELLTQEHENIIQVIELLTCMDTANIARNYYAVMENCSHGPMMMPGVKENSNKISKKRVNYFSRNDRQTGFRFELAEAKKYMREILLGLQFLHEKLEYCHLDLKPTNVTFQDTPGKGLVPKLIDFGNACLISQDDEEVGLSMVNIGSGTHGFMPMELVDGAIGSSRALDGKKIDVFALGVTYFTMLSGKLPFLYTESSEYPEILMSGGGTFKIVDRSLKTTLMRPKKNVIRTSVLKKKEVELIHHMCASEPEKRPSVQILLETYFSGGK